MLRMTAFLRLSCLTLHQPGAYSTLMQTLCSHQDWWITCEATPGGTLTSSDPEINRLLEPINRLHQSQILPLAA
jgi:hypothetical protein